MKIESVGIIGFGAFGRLLAKEFSTKAEVKVYNRSQLEDSGEFSQVSLEEVSHCDVLFLCVPFEAYEPILALLKDYTNKETILVDVCSVKLKPIEKIQQMLPEVKLVATHPLFGPESSRDDQKRVVICTEDSDAQATELVTSFFEMFGWKIIETSADNHDKQMAQVHALTFFIAQGLVDLNLPKPDLPTGFYDSLAKLVDIQSKHTDSLTRTIEKYNPYASEIRNRVLKKLEELNLEYTSAS